jgi:hypothetical protein
MMKFYLTIIFFAYAFFFSTTMASEQVVGLDQLTLLSDSIVLGKVTNKQIVYQNKHIWTHYTVKVNEYVKGAGETTIKFKQPGGSVGKFVTRVAGVKQFSIGSSCCFFFWSDASNELQLLGFNQGAIDVLYTSEEDENPRVLLNSHPSFEKSKQLSAPRSTKRSVLNNLANNARWLDFKKLISNHE